MNLEKIACGIWIVIHLFVSINGEYESKLGRITSSRNTLNWDTCLCVYGETCLQNVHSRLPKTNRTALHLAARYGKEECIGVLIKQGADVEAEDKDGRTAMALAAWRRHCNVIRALIRIGARKEAAGRQYSSNIDQCLKEKDRNKVSVPVERSFVESFAVKDEEGTSQQGMYRTYGRNTTNGTYGRNTTNGFNMTNTTNGHYNATNASFTGSTIVIVPLADVQMKIKDGYRYVPFNEVEKDEALQKNVIKAAVDNSYYSNLIIEGGQLISNRLCEDDSCNMKSIQFKLMADQYIPNKLDSQPEYVVMAGPLDGRNHNYNAHFQCLLLLDLPVTRGCFCSSINVSSVNLRPTPGHVPTPIGWFFGMYTFESLDRHATTVYKITADRGAGDRQEYYLAGGHNHKWSIDHNKDTLPERSWIRNLGCIKDCPDECGPTWQWLRDSSNMIYDYDQSMKFECHIQHDVLGYHYIRALDTHCHFRKYHKTSSFDDSMRHCHSDATCAGLYHPGCTGSDYYSCKFDPGFPGGHPVVGPSFQPDTDGNNHCVYMKIKDGRRVG